MIVRLRGRFRNAQAGAKLFTLAPDIPIAIESGLLGLMLRNPAISAKVVKVAGIKLEAN